jgi:hypothetical protein
MTELIRPGETVRDAVIRQMTLYRIQRQIFCKHTGQVLDVRSAVALVGGPDDDDVLAVLSPDAWARIPDAGKQRLRAEAGVTSVWIAGREQPDALGA